MELWGHSEDLEKTFSAYLRSCSHPLIMNHGENNPPLILLVGNGGYF